MPFLSQKAGWARLLCPSADLSLWGEPGLGLCKHACASEFLRQALLRKAAGWAETANDQEGDGRLKFCLCLAANGLLDQSDTPTLRRRLLATISTQRNAASCWGQRPAGGAAAALVRPSGGPQGRSGGPSFDSTPSLTDASPCRCAR